MKWHWGKPENPGQIRFHTGTLLYRETPGEQRMAKKQFTVREIEGLFGVSFGDTFIGVQTFGKSGWDNARPEPWKPARAKREAAK